MRKKKEEKKKVLSQNEIDYANNLFGKLLAGEVVSHTVKTDKGEFAFRYPSNTDSIEIERRKNAMLKGLDTANADGETILLISAMASIDVCLISAPKWWRGAEKCPDRYLIGELYRGFLQRCLEIQEILRMACPGRDDRGASDHSSAADSMGGRAFPVFTD